MSYSHPLTAYKTKIVGKKRFEEKQKVPETKFSVFKKAKQSKKQLERRMKGNYNEFYG